MENKFGGIYRLLSGEEIDLSGLSAGDRDFLSELARQADAGADYFDLLLRVKGPGARLLQDGMITRDVIHNVAYRAAHDIADRVGVRQGYLLDPVSSTP